MLSYILQVTICLAVFYTLYAAVLSRETFFGINRWFLLGTLGLSLLIPVMPSLVRTQPDPSLISYTLEPVVIGIQNASSALTPEVSAPTWLTVLLIFYWTGVGLLLLRFIHGLRSILRIYRHRNSHHLQDRARVIVSSEVHVPFSFFKWIFLPREHGLSEQEVEEIITHESAHVFSGHSIDVLLMELVCIFLWPSPVIYFYRKSLRRVHEYLADAVVLRHTPLKQYGHLLLSRTAPGMQLALANHFFHNQLKHRIMMMTKHKSKRSALLKYAALLPVLLLVLALFAFQGSNHDPLQADYRTDTVQDTVPGEIFKVVEEMPRFPGCEDSGLEGDELWNCSLKKMLEHVYMSITYPQEARKAGISGRAVAQFIIRSDGRVTDARIVRSLGYGTDEVVLGVINTMPVWRPGYQKGEAVNVEFTLPVSFKIEDDTQTTDDKENEPNPVVVTTLPDKPAIGNGVFKVVEEMPCFPGCEDSGLAGEELRQCAFEKLVAHMQEHMRYPEEAKKAGIEGRSVVQFIVGADGSIRDVKIVRSIGYGTDEVVLDIVKAMPAWRPGYQRGKAVDVQMTIPVSFVLPAEAQSDGRAPKVSGAAFNIQAFPVPSGDQLNYTIDLTPGSGNVVIELLSSNGNVVLKDNKTLQLNKEASHSGSFNIHNVTPGTYVIRAQWAGNSATKSVVIQ